MDKHRREQLQKRRALLQEKVKLKEIKDRLSYLTPYLENAGFDYKIYYENEYLIWLYENVDIRKKDGYRGVHEDFQIDVQDSEAKEQIKLNHKDVGTYLQSNEISSMINKDENVVLCQLGGDPDIEIPFSAFLENPGKFIGLADIWLVSTKKDWIIENTWGQNGHPVIRFIKLIDSKPILNKVIYLELAEHLKKNANSAYNTLLRSLFE